MSCAVLPIPTVSAMTPPLGTTFSIRYCILMLSSTPASIWHIRQRLRHWYGYNVPMKLVGCGAAGMWSGTQGRCNSA
eukprot:3306572-Prymnesium_polylepis.1